MFSGIQLIARLARNSLSFKTEDFFHTTNNYFPACFRGFGKHAAKLQKFSHICK